MTYYANKFLDSLKYEEAEELLKGALLINREHFKNDHPDLARSINNMADFYCDVGKYTEAEPLLREALDMRRRLYKGDHPDLALSINNMAYFYSKIGKYTEAEPLLREALDMRRRLYKGNHPDLALSINNMAGFYWDVGKYTEAERLYKEALSVYRNYYEQNQLAMSEKEKEQFWNKIKQPFESFFSFILKRVKENPSITEQALNNVLFTKAMLLNSTKKVRQRILNSGNEDAIYTYKDWIQTKESLNKLYSMSIDEQKKTGLNVDSLENITNDLEKKLNLLSNDFAKASDKKQYSFQDVKSKLKENESAVEIIRFKYYDNRWTDKVYYMALITNIQTKDYPKMVLIENGNELETDLFSRYKSDVASSKGVYSEYKKTLKEIYAKLWKPINDVLPVKSERIYLSVDGIYNKINLNSLINPETDNYLLSERDIRILTSTRDLAEASESQEDKRTKKTAALFGFPKYDLDSAGYNMVALNYKRDMEENIYGGTLDSIRAGNWDQLPGTKIEVEMIDSLLRTENWQTRKYIGEEALEEAVKSLDSPNILHIATHGYFIPKEEISKRNEEGRLATSMFGLDRYKAYSDPLLRSGLLLAGVKNGMETEAGGNRNRDNGVLTAKEVMNLNLDNTELVVLSACETGLGDIRNGEGVYGLQRAFRVAGAKSLINSLWKVPDKETQELMMKFYTYWIKGGKTKIEAFRQAQEEMLHLHPYFWAAFVMIGE